MTMPHPRRRPRRQPPRRLPQPPLAEALRDQAPAGVTVDIVDGLGERPVLQRGHRRRADVPAAAAALREQVAAADRVLAVTPEYNGTMPAVLNNAIDWLSRPYGAGRHRRQAVRRRRRHPDAVRRQVGARGRRAAPPASPAPSSSRTSPSRSPPSSVDLLDRPEVLASAASAPSTPVARCDVAAGAGRRPAPTRASVRRRGRAPRPDRARAGRRSSAAARCRRSSWSSTTSNARRRRRSTRSARSSRSPTTGARPGRASSRRSGAARTLAAVRRADRDQGPQPDRRGAHHLRLGGVRRLRAGRLRRASRSRSRRPGMVSLGKTSTPEFGSPCYTEPDVAPPAVTPWDRDPHGRRLLRRRGRRGRGRPGARGPGLRRRRLDPDPGLLLRAGRAQAHPRPDQRLTRCTATRSGLATAGPIARTVARRRGAARRARRSSRRATRPGRHLLSATFLEACDREPGPAPGRALHRASHRRRRGRPESASTRLGGRLAPARVARPRGRGRRRAAPARGGRRTSRPAGRCSPRSRVVAARAASTCSAR